MSDDDAGADMPKEAIRLFEMLMSCGLPFSQVAAEMRKAWPPATVSKMIALGPGRFLDSLKAADPASPLVTTATGEQWLSDLFGELALQSLAYMPAAALPLSHQHLPRIAPVSRMWIDSTARTECEVGAGIAVATLDGFGRLVGLKLDPEFVTPVNARMISDLVVAACRSGIAKIEAGNMLLMALPPSPQTALPAATPCTDPACTYAAPVRVPGTPNPKCAICGDEIPSDFDVEILHGACLRKYPVSGWVGPTT